MLWHIIVWLRDEIIEQFWYRGDPGPIFQAAAGTAAKVEAQRCNRLTPDE